MSLFEKEFEIENDEFREDNHHLFDLIDVNVREITILSEKIKWYSRFYKSYKNAALPECEKLYSADTRHFVAYKGNIELGYLYISNWGKHYFDDPNLAWSVSGAYTKPKYRGQGVFRKLIMHCYKNEDTKLIYISKDRFKSNLDYFYSLGFTKYLNIPGDDLIYIFSRELLNKFKEKDYKLTSQNKPL